MTLAAGRSGTTGASSRWLEGLRTYLGVAAAGNLIWESLQLPLYTIWSTGTLREQAFAVVHCTLGDLLIALSTLTLALVLVGERGWPRDRFGHVAVLTLVLGVAYTAFSEWLNVVVRASWAYSEWMPVIPLFGFRLGVSPLRPCSISIGAIVLTVLSIPAWAQAGGCHRRGGDGEPSAARIRSGASASRGRIAPRRSGGSACRVDQAGHGKTRTYCCNQRSRRCA
jgi:hypothetical protein